MSDTILIIDDEAAIRESLAGILLDEGFTPLTAASAEDGLQLLDEKDIRLILLDIWMPGMDGLEALKLIKQRFTLPVIMISGHGTIETAVQATRSGPTISSKNRSPTTEPSSRFAKDCSWRNWSGTTSCCAKTARPQSTSPAPAP